jgi:ankyrin repeat protein
MIVFSRLSTCTTAVNPNELLSEALKEHNNEDVLTALQRGADPNAVGSHDRSVLMIAAEHCNVDAIELLIRFGARIDDRFIGDMTALHYAVFHRKLASVTKLLELRADPNIATGAGWTALMRANSVEMAEVLVNANANVKQRNVYGSTVLTLALLRGNSDLLRVIAPAIRRQDAQLLLDWMIAVAPLQLPICAIMSSVDLSLMSFFR